MSSVPLKIKYLPPSWKFGSDEANMAFIGGFGGVPTIYHRGLKKIAPWHSLFQFDVLNYSSNGYDRKLELGFYADILAGILEEYPNVDTLIGHSLGGAITLKYLLNHSHRIKRIILINSLGVPIGKINEIAWNNIREPKPEILKRLNLSDIKGYMQAYINNPLYFTRTMDLCFKVDLRDEITDCQLDTLILWSDQDELLPLELGRSLHELLPESRFVPIKSYHNPFQLNEETIARIWEEHALPFLRK